MLTLIFYDYLTVNKVRNDFDAFLPESINPIKLNIYKGSTICNPQ